MVRAAQVISESNQVRAPTAEALVVFGRFGVIVAAGLLLTSIAGAAVMAAPVTVPLLILIAARSRGTGWRVAGTTVATLTILEASWTLTWALWKEPAGSFGLALTVALAFAYVLWRSTRGPTSARA